MGTKIKRDLVEVFGYAPDDLTQACRTLWKISACPFINKPCIKHNHDQTITYGTCSVTSPYGDCVICPNRLYANNYETLRNVSNDACGDDVEFLTFDEFIPRRDSSETFSIALGHDSGREVQVKRMSMDWVLAKVKDGELLEYTGVEVQSIDITGNYRDAWYGYKNLKKGVTRDQVASSQHGLNWANVHKRLIPQLIRKGLIYSKSDLVNNGLYFLLPEIVYGKFEEIIGHDIPLVEDKGCDVLSVNTYDLSPPVEHGQQRSVTMNRSLRFKLDEFCERFISGAQLPSGGDLDHAVRRVLGLR